MVLILDGSEYFFKAGDSLYNLNTISLRDLSDFCLYYYYYYYYYSYYSCFNMIRTVYSVEINL
jgi:hypothetical protein